jgi:Peptidase family S41
MRRRFPLLLCAFLAVLLLVLQGQAPNRPAGPEMAAILNFEIDQTGMSPLGWGGGPPGTIFIDRDTVHGGLRSARLERNTSSPEMFSTITRTIPIDFSGTTVEYRGFLRTENVSEFTGLWLREDGIAGPVAFDNMQQRRINGTREWTEYSITLPLRPEAKQLYFGVLLSGTGKAWADDLQLFVDAKPVWDAPKAERVETILDSDHEFDSGSKVSLSSLTPLQIRNLEMLGKVWGFVKYHHPAITAGRRHWDYELFRVMPKVLAAEDRNAASTAVRDWIRGIGDVPACTNCAKPASGENLHFDADLRWLNDEQALGHDLSGLLRTIYRNRSRGAKFYISQVPGVGNPVFEHEPAYTGVQIPDAGYQLLGLYRYWNAIQYWYPNRNILDQDWNEILVEFIPRIALAKNRGAYQLEMLQLIVKLTDTHANLNVAAQIQPPAGTCQLPVITRFIGKRAVVTGYSEPTLGPDSGLKPGDVIESLDGEAADQLVAKWMPYYSGSNEAARLRNLARSITRGACGTVKAVVRRDEGSLTISADRAPLSRLSAQAGGTHDRSGDTFQMLADDVAYLKLSSVKIADAASYINRAKDTKGLIIDIRNYPSEFVVFALGSLLVERPTAFARFTAGDLDNPGAFNWTAPVQLMPQSPHYSGRIVILVDEVSISQAEYTAMAFRSAPRAIVVGSTTSGADGNVSAIPLPGGLNTAISGIGVFYPDKRPTQRISIIPDVEVIPTIEGIRTGRDEVLEEAIRRIRSVVR